MNVIPDKNLIDYVLELSNEHERKVIETGMLTSQDLFSRITQLRDTLLVTPALTCKKIEPSTHLFNCLLKTIETPNAFEGFVDRLTVFLDLPEAKVRELLSSTENAEKEWNSVGLPGVLSKSFDGGPRHTGSECSLVRIEPGKGIPQHGHLGDEWGFLLQGEAAEDSGRTIRPGDMVYQSKDSSHSFSNIGELPVIFVLIHRGVLFE